MDDAKVTAEDDERDAAHHPPPPPLRYKPNQLRVNSSSAVTPKRQHHSRKHSLDDSLAEQLDKLESTANAHHDHLDFQAAPPVPLAEFVGAGGGTGIFKVPGRAAVHPGRPPCLELRPHPLRETQVGKFLRNIACSDRQLWAGHESGLRMCNLKDAYEPGCGLGGRVMRGDEDATPFHESATTSPIMCLLADDGNRLVWSGHKDGKVRSWRMDRTTLPPSPFKEALCWQAHRAPVLSLAMTFYGDLWTGSEGGVIRVWPWENMDKSLCLKPEERYMAALLVERSFVDLRTQVTVNGICSLSSQDVKCLVADNVRAKVWCASSLSFSLWDARSRELIKVFNIEGQIENRVDMSAVQQEQQPAAAVEDELKVKFVSTSKKEKSGGGFLQRSRNAIMGAADAVRRVATRSAGAFVEDTTKRTEALVMAPDGLIWSGCSNGVLVQWDGNGNRLQDFTHHPWAVQCFCTFGTRVYVGYASGYIHIFDLDGNVIAGWVSHSCPVIKLAVGDGHVFSLATHGGIRGWNVASPGPTDSILRSELAAKQSCYTRRDNVRIVVGTWNVGQGRASHDALMSWLGSVVSDVGIVVIGLQEVDMGAGFLAMSAAKETVGLEGSSQGQWWLDNIGKALEEGKTFERMGSRQLAGLVISLWVRKNLRTHVGDIDAGAVPCGFGRAIGNKGGVGLRIRVYDRIMCFVNCHLAAHLEAVNRRNADFDHIFRNMVFNRSSNFLNNAAAGVSTAVHMFRGTNVMGGTIEEVRPELAEADMVVFLGDFNYRLFGISYDEARDFVSQRCFDWLREKDQLRAEMKGGKVFQGMREAIIKFPPTYKFERHRAGLAGYDSGEKKRIPAWCDRIIYRDNRSSPTSECNLDCPVIASVLQYEACMDVTESDHKPVRCKFAVQIAHVDRSVRRNEFGRIFRTNETIQAMLEESRYLPDTAVSTNNIVLQNQEIFTLRIFNKSATDVAIFRIVCESQNTLKDEEQNDPYLPRGSFGFPRWIEVTPAAGTIKAEHMVEVSIKHEEFTLEEFVDGIPQNWWSEDTRDKEVILAVILQGSCSTKTITHRVSVRHCFSTKALRLDSRLSSGSSSSQPGSFHFSEPEKIFKSDSKNNNDSSRA